MEAVKEAFPLVGRCFNGEVSTSIMHPGTSANC